MTRRSRAVPKAKRGELWMADLGFVAKVRPVLILSVDYQNEERAVVTYVLRTTSACRIIAASRGRSEETSVTIIL